MDCHMILQGGEGLLVCVRVLASMHVCMCVFLYDSVLILIPGFSSFFQEVQTAIKGKVKNGDGYYNFHIYQNV